MRTCVVIALFIACVANVLSQQLSSQTRAQAIAAAFTKHKNVAKEKHGVRKEKYKDVRSEPLVQPNVSDYSGTYEVEELSYLITIQVSNDGSVQANGEEKGRPFRFENAKIEEALLTASKVYQDGAAEKFEGVFLKRIDRESPTDAGTTAFGLGVILNSPVQLDSNTYDKLFYKLKQ